MKDILESTIITTLLSAMLFLAGVFFTYIFGIKYYIRIPEQGWKCTKAQIINNDPSRTECTLYVKKNSNTEELIKE